MAKVTLLTMPRSVLLSNDPSLVIKFLNATVSKSDDRFPPYLEWSYVFSHDIDAQEMEAIGLGVSVETVRAGGTS